MLKHRRGQPRALSNQVVAITGGARGIGHATARALAHQGARVAIGDLDGDLAGRVAGELGGGGFGVGVDVTDNAAFTAFLDGVEH
ncbi:MAG: SDR family NAD(P)-dependent oxidoreductase, partial [Actinomycetota bacterium]|nr:SDR family NAD(P)-dependent oxidoreductase [Actinomycetota bacterium]